ncbi:dipeptide epimerase [Adhaeribacter sp. BT258]|uniref:Dipeptide epimerase n=1 Tax=Adhaeribacter terrigena TaxID=2793070 RepID=A0ABS1BYC5_9BACT|nr:enolase C-terminal domain-like protein [Adhaeribacter terrigena]MBK0402053.1 dipeptide epimerase [Adhaeribacter terrigena]
MLNWHIEALALELNYVWKIARNTSESKINLFVRVSDEHHTGIGEAAPNIRYHETPENLIVEFGDLVAAGLNKVRSLDDLLVLLNTQKPANALRFAVESAYIHFICQRLNLTVPDFLGVPEPLPLATTFSLPIMEPEKIAGFIAQNNLSRFSALKVKVNRETGLETVHQVTQNFSGPLLIDANEAWTEPETLLVFLEKLRPYNIMFIEQPMPATEEDGYIYLKKKSPFDIYADESVLDQPEFERLKPQFHGVNMKLMKAGGYLNGKRILEEAAVFGMKTMIGCMVETSLGIWSALQLSRLAQTADLDGFLIVKAEPFQIVKEEAGLLYLR